MKRTIGLLAIAATVLFFGYTLPAPAQAAGGGRVIVPASSVERSSDAGVRAHTNFVIYSDGIRHDSGPGATWETPGSMGCVYGITGPIGINPCPISTSTTDPSGGGGAIALVDAYDNPDAASDLSTFSTQFGLPAATFKKVYAQGKKPPNNAGGWSIEEALDIEWAHAMAPSAKIILVEAYASSNSDLFAAEKTAASMVASDGGGDVSNSWSEGEFSGETSDDSKYFATSLVVYFASSGDSGGVGYPSTSPNVVSAGGTKVNRTGNNFTSEVVWNDSSGETGGGPSAYEPIPSYQSGIVSGTKRGTPDFSFNASPYSGVAMYDKDGGYNWIQVGGTSVSSPSLAGIVNAAGHFYSSTATEQGVLYSGLGNTGIFRDITSGSCKGYSAGPGWDFCTGLGTDQTETGK